MLVDTECIVASVQAALVLIEEIDSPCEDVNYDYS